MTIIDSRGMDIEDIKSVLISKGEVISLEDNAELLNDYCILLGICLEANTGNLKAKKYLSDEVMHRFSDFIPNEYKDRTIKRVHKFLEPIEN